MGKKLVLGTLLVGLIAILLAGGVIRTLDKTANVAEARGLGSGRDDSCPESGERQGQGWGRGAQDEGPVERQYLNRDGVTTEQVSYEGTVAQAPVGGGDLYIKTEVGQEIKVGTGPGYMEAQGFTLQEGDGVSVQGYMEGEELIASVITSLDDGQSISLRDEAGRPAWAGSGKRALERQATQARDGQVWGGGGQGQGQSRGQSSYGAQPSGAAGLGQADVGDLTTVGGTVLSATDSVMVVETTFGEEATVENRPWWFALEQGFAAQPGDQVVLVGFYDGDRFEVSQLENATSGLVIPIREASGRPLWAGRGRRGE